MRYWNIKPQYRGRLAKLKLNSNPTTMGFYANTLIDAFAKARKSWPMASVLICESATPTPELLKFPATMTY